MNIENLRIYYNWCLDNLLGKINEEAFDMEQFSNGDTWSKNVDVICGSVACALGYAPRCFGIKSEDYCKENGEFSYSTFCERIFGGSWFKDAPLAFIFDGSWADIDNTLEGALKRMKLVVNNGEDYDYSCWDKEVYEHVALTRLTGEGLHCKDKEEEYKKVTIEFKDDTTSNIEGVKSIDYTDTLLTLIGLEGNRTIKNCYPFANIFEFSYTIQDD